MITLKTPKEQIFNELKEEEPKAIYWLKKKYHGSRGYEAMRDDMINECARTHKQQISDVVEYISPKGNRWMVFECATYYKDSHAVNSHPMTFCYYETYGSCGAYFIGRNNYDTDGDEGCVIMFTDHFFLRFCERLGIQMRSRWMIQKFIEVIPGFTFGFGKKNEYGQILVDCRLPGSIGRGILHKDGRMIEIRTYLTDKQLNNKQKKETERLREVGDRQVFEPAYIRMMRLKNSENFDEALSKEIINVADLTGCDKGDMMACTNVIIFIVMALVDLGYAKPDDKEFFIRMGRNIQSDKILDIVTDYESKDSKNIANALFDVITSIGKTMAIRNYDAVAVMDKMIEHWTDACKKYKENIL